MHTVTAPVMETEVLAQVHCTDLGDARIVHPVARNEREPYRYNPVTFDHWQVTLSGRHVADLRRCADRGWHLFGVEAPDRQLAWAGGLVAMNMLAPEVLAAQADASPGTYLWGRLHLHKVELYTQPLAAAVSA